MADDRLSAVLEEIRERSERPLGPSAMAMPISSPAVRGLLESAADVPRLLAAIESVLILLGEARGCCYNYTTTPGAWENFDPAGVRATILANLTGEAEHV